MADIYRANIARVDLDGDLVREHVGSLLATGDKQANRFGVEVYRGGAAVSVSGMALVGYFIRPETDTVVISGTVSGNTAYVDLPQSCYTQEGAFTLALKLSGGDVVQTVRIMDGRIVLTQEGDLIDPGTVVPTLDDVLAQIAACEAATEAATAAAAEASQYYGLDIKLAERLQIAADETATWLDRGDVASNYGLAASRRWFLAHDVPAGATIDSLAWYNMQTEGTPTVQVEVWERVGNKLQKVWSKQVTTGVKQTYTVEIGYKTKHAAMVGMLPSSASIGFSSGVAGQWLMVTKPVTADEPYLDPDLTELDTADVVSFGDGYIANATITYTRKYGTIIPIGLGQEYETIQAAIDSITDDSADNPYTLLLMPSAVPYARFSLQRKLDEVRPTNRAPRWISIIGIDKARTVVQSDTGEYESPPAEVVTNGLLKNITFRMTNDCPDATPLKGGYAVHFDCNTPNNIGFDLLVEDCDFESATGPGVGIGVHENERLVFRRCRFYNTADASYKPNSSYKNLADYGCAFAHTSLRADAQNMRITFEGCVGVCKEGTKSLWLGDAGEYTKEKCWFEYTLIGNTFWNTALGKPAYYISSELYANPMNHGNNLLESITLDEDVQSGNTMPCVFIDGEIPTSKTETLAELTYRQGEDTWHAYLKIKCQGSSSMDYPKKNFTIKMFEDADRTQKKKVAFGLFGEEKRNKYVLKANYVDHLHARNIVSARLWSEVVASRPDYSTLPAEMRGSPCNGAIDGFPALVYANGVYQGIYTWNISKDADMWGMDEDNPNHALLCAETNDNGDATRMDNPCNFRALWDGADGNHWSVEAGTNSEAVKDSLNALIACVMDTDDDTFRAKIGEHLDVQAAIDYYIFACAICGIDNLAKNMLLATYDGTKWIPGMYDMDSTWGLYWDGSKFIPATTACSGGYQNTQSLLWEKIVKNYSEEIIQRKKELRASVLTNANILMHFEQFVAGIGRDAYDDDLVVYPDIPSADSNNIWQVRNFVKPRMDYLDKWLEDESLLYELAAPVDVDADASKAINTGVKLFAADIDFTLAIDATATQSDWDGTEQGLFSCHEQPSPWTGLSAYRNRSRSEKYVVRSILADGQVEAYTGVAVESTTRFVLIIRHVAGSGEYVITSYDGGTTSTTTMQNAWSDAITNNLWIGCADGDWDPKRAFGGTINRCAVYGRYLDGTEVSEIIAEVSA